MEICGLNLQEVAQVDQEAGVMGGNPRHRLLPTRPFHLHHTPYSNNSNSKRKLLKPCTRHDFVRETSLLMDNHGILDVFYFLQAIHGYVMRNSCNNKEINVLQTNTNNYQNLFAHVA